MKIVKIKLSNDSLAITEDAIFKALKSNNREPQTALGIAEFWHYNWQEGCKHELPGLDVHTIEAKLLELANLKVVRKVSRRGRDENGYEFFTMV